MRNLSRIRTVRSHMDTYETYEFDESHDYVYEMGYADGRGDYPGKAKEFLIDLSRDDCVRNLPRDLKARLKRLTNMKPEQYA